MCEVRPAILVRESNTQLLRYSLDTCTSFSVFTYFQASEMLQWGPEFLHNFIIDYTIDFLHYRFHHNHRKVNCYWRCKFYTHIIYTHSLTYIITLTFTGIHTELKQTSNNKCKSNFNDCIHISIPSTTAFSVTFLMCVCCATVTRKCRESYWTVSNSHHVAFF